MLWLKRHDQAIRTAIFLSLLIMIFKENPMLTVTLRTHEICHKQIQQPYALIELLRIKQEIYDDQPTQD